MADLFESSSADEKRRARVALQASHQIDALAQALRRNPDDDDLASAVSVRVGQLACLIMSALGDARHEIDDMERQVFREEADHG